jgi:hypothetical protein
MAQNRSSAVMAQRAEPNDALDDFPTPPWATRALCEHLICIKNLKIWEPACNRGYMALPLMEYAFTAASDVHDYGYGAVRDFLWPGETERFDWIITNPPFRLAEQFIWRGLDIAKVGVAVLVRTAFLEGASRYENLFSKRPPAIVAPFSERVIMHKGVLRDPGVRYFDPISKQWKLPSTATSYAWLVWLVDYRGEPRVKWIPPCRSKLERPGDYPKGEHDGGEQEQPLAAP